MFCSCRLKGFGGRHALWRALATFGSMFGSAIFCGVDNAPIEQKIALGGKALVCGQNRKRFNQLGCQVGETAILSAAGRHFATSVAKVRVPYLMWQQHLTLRQHATGNYGEIFERNVGPQSALKLPRGLNNLWNKGGLQYAPPIR